MWGCGIYLQKAISKIVKLKKLSFKESVRCNSRFHAVPMKDIDNFFLKLINK